MVLPAISAAALFLVVQQPQQPPPPKASIEGMVVRIGTAEPIRARVTVSRVVVSTAPAVPTPPPIPGATPGIPSVMTDSQGKFVVKDLETGSYRLTVAANGYARQEYGQRVFGTQGTPIDLATGQALKDVVVRLTPAGYVTGRLTDERGEPAIGVQAQLLRPSYNAQGQRTFQSGGLTRTDDRGEYRLFWVTPGRYYLLAPAGPALNRSLELAGVGDSPNGIAESYAITYYPGVPDVKEASIIEVRPGVELSAIDFSIPRQRLFRIRGRLIDSRTGQKPLGAAITTSSTSITGGGTFSSAMGQSYDPASGTFEIRDVSPGPYTVTAVFQEPNTPVASPFGGEVWPGVACRAVAFSTKNLKAQLLLGRKGFTVAVDEAVVSGIA